MIAYRALGQASQPCCVLEKGFQAAEEYWPVVRQLGEQAISADVFTGKWLLSGSAKHKAVLCSQSAASCCCQDGFQKPALATSMQLILSCMSELHVRLMSDGIDHPDQAVFECRVAAKRDKTNRFLGLSGHAHPSRFCSVGLGRLPPRRPAFP